MVSGQSNWEMDCLESANFYYGGNGRPSSGAFIIYKHSTRLFRINLGSTRSPFLWISDGL